MAIFAQLHFDGDLTDTAGNTWTASGGAAVSTAPKKAGTGSLYIPSGGQLYTPMNTALSLYNKSFEIVFSLCPTAAVSYGQVLRVENDAGTGYSYVISASADGATLNFLASSSGNDWDKLSLSLGSVTLNAWNTYKITRDRDTGVYSSYKNGSFVATVTVEGDFAAGAGSKLRIGAAYNGSYSFTGAYIDEITITDPEATITIRPQAMTGGM